MYLGIDLGTSNSAIAGLDGSNLRIFKTKEGTDTLPSVIYIDRRGHQFVGARAYENVKRSPENAAQGFKRLIGTSSPVKFAASSTEMSPEECSAVILRTLLAQAKEAAGNFEEKGAVVTVPAAFNQMQNEATFRAAQSAGLDRVGLLQEPIAASMASMANSTIKNGQFLIYDMGGGTFDAAIVQSVGGEVNVVAHGGINMLGGRDFDRKLVNEFVHPWLLNNFSLPLNFHTLDPYKHMLRIARDFAEKAKIQLSTSENASIYASEDDLRIADEDGNDIYIDVPIARADLERIIEEDIERSIAECRKLLNDNSYSHEDIDRIVLVGGPSKMPCIRERTPQELGIPVDLDTDPMTAASMGAAVFAESREWSKGSTKRKPTRATAKTKGPIQLQYDYRERISDDKTRIRISASEEADVAGHRLRIDGEDGWTSGLVDLEPELRIEVPVLNQGENRYRASVYDPLNAPVLEASVEICIVRTFASAGGIPAQQNISVKVAHGADESRRNELELLIEKGTILPASGTKTFRSAKNLRGGQDDAIWIEIYQQPDLNVSNPSLNLHIGDFKIDGKTDLEEDAFIRRGDEVAIDWNMNDNGILRCSVTIPSVELELRNRSFYSSAGGHQDFEGANGEALAEAALAKAERDIEEVKRTVGHKAADEVDEMEREIKRQREEIVKSGDADTRRSVAENAMEIRRKAASVKQNKENRADSLLRDMMAANHQFESLNQNNLDDASIERFRKLSDTVAQATGDNDIAGAERALKEMQSIINKALLEDFDYLRLMFETLRSERHMSVDKALHSELTMEGERRIAARDKNGLLRVIGAMFNNMFDIGGENADLEALANLMR